MPKVIWHDSYCQPDPSTPLRYVSPRKLKLSFIALTVDLPSKIKAHFRGIHFLTTGEIMYPKTNVVTHTTLYMKMFAVET